jgi:hypothetical protein
VEGENGIRDLVERYEKSHESATGEGQKFPTSEKDFLREQRKDPELLKIIEQITSTGLQDPLIIDKAHYARLKRQQGDMGTLRQEQQVARS